MNIRKATTDPIAIKRFLRKVFVRKYSINLFITCRLLIQSLMEKLIRTKVNHHVGFCLFWLLCLKNNPN